MLTISVTDDINEKARGFKPVDVKSIDQLQKLITTRNWSCGTFENGHRNIKNFKSANCIALDIDEGVTIEEATKKLVGYTYFIAPTKSHLKEKNGTVCERFRILLGLTRTITSREEYAGTYAKLLKMFPTADIQCKDPSRYWAPSTELTNDNKGKNIEPEMEEVKKLVPKDVVIGVKGHLCVATLEFLFNGAPGGEWNTSLYKAALDLRSQGYTQEESTNMLETATYKYDGSLDSTDLTTIDQAFKGEIEHDKRGVEDCFDFEKVGSIMKDRKEIDWLVKDLLTTGAVSIIAGPPKSGKSTIIRQLGKVVAQGGLFLGRNVKKGKVLYLALEEQRQLLAQQLLQLGISDSDEFYLHCGPVSTSNRFEALRNVIESQKPTFVVVDTMILFAGVSDINNYNEMYGALTKFREIARDTGCHIMHVHHQNKGENRGTNSIMGSSAIHGSVDAAIIFDKIGDNRFVTTSQRGGIPLTRQLVLFDERTQSYSLGTKEFGE